MTDKFIIKRCESKKEKNVTVSIRIDRDLLEAFDQMAYKSDHSRNQVLCKALKFALDHAECDSQSDPQE